MFLWCSHLTNNVRERLEDWQPLVSLLLMALLSNDDNMLCDVDDLLLETD